VTAPTQILIVPGLGGSGPEHWQSRLQRSRPAAKRVEQADWDNPVRSEWIARLATAIEGAPGSILVGHSLGCALIVYLAALRPGLPVTGALLVAPADADRAGGIAPQVGEFAPIPLKRLPFPSVVVASTNDPYMAIGRARVLAQAWESRLVDVGPCGHINVPSGFGPWPFGESLLDNLASECRQATLAARGVSNADDTALSRRVRNVMCAI
jgi:uncharacterized protein